MGWAWGGFLIGLAVVMLAAGIPFLVSHRQMRQPRDVSDAHAPGVRPL